MVSDSVLLSENSGARTAIAHTFCWLQATH